MENTWHRLVDRFENFYIDYELLKFNAYEDEAYYAELDSLLSTLVAYPEDFPQKLYLAAKYVYDLITLTNDEYEIFSQDVYFYTVAFEACYFYSLCMFIHLTKKLKGISTGALDAFNQRKGNISETYHYDTTESDLQAFRKMRNRRLNERPVYTKRPEWSAIPKSSVREWSLYFEMQNWDDDLKDSYKRVSALYSDVRKLFASPIDESYKDRLDVVYKKFTSKLNKIGYEGFLKLCSNVLSCIYKDKEYLGINLYRFEKLFRLYTTMTEVKALIACQDKEEEANVLYGIVARNDIFFPKVYDQLGYIKDPQLMASIAKRFQSLLNQFTPSALLLCDFLVEDSSEEHWEEIILGITNGMAERVLYAPEDMDFSLPSSEANEMYIKASSAYLQSQRQYFRTM